MANIALSEAEKTFILHGVEEDFRCDGRGRRDYRPMELETDVVSNASGSARLRLANSDVLVGIKTEIDTPSPFASDKGKIEFFVDCSANATPDFEGRGGEELAKEISDALSKGYHSDLAFNLKSLSLLIGQQCWKLYVDILILECGGNLFDAVSLAVKAALFNTRLPKVTATVLDGGNVDLTLSDDPYDCDRLDVENIPILVTVCRIGESCVVDPSAEEEECSVASVVVSVSIRDGKSFLTHVHTTGMGSFHHDTLESNIDFGLVAGEYLNAALIKTLEREEQRTDRLGRKEIFGFLK